MPSAEHRFPPEPSSVADARRFIRSLLTDWDADGVEFAASQALTELATNAVLHAKTAFTVTVEWHREVLRLCVEDESVKLPVQRSYARDAATGRGLTLVATLCRAWGVDGRPRGKAVWCEITSDASEAVGEPDLDAFLDLDDALADAPPVKPTATASVAA